jgi:aerobic C4-dicarboxylate transport protein
MSEARALTNVIGNGVAALVVARWTGDLDSETMTRLLRLGASAELEPVDAEAGPPITVLVAGNRAN